PRGVEGLADKAGERHLPQDAGVEEQRVDRLAVVRAASRVGLLDTLSAFAGPAGRPPGHQSEMASSPGTIGRVRGSRPRRAMLPTHARMPRKTASLNASNPRVRGSMRHRTQRTGCALDTAQTVP